MNDLQKIRNRITTGGFNKEVVMVANLLREFGVAGDFLGRDYEVYDPKGVLLCRIRQKALTIRDLNGLLESLHELQQYESEQSKKKGRR
jgi:hypothetical protein